MITQPNSPTPLETDTSWRIGVRRFIPTSREAMWQLLTSQKGIALWLGKGAAINIEDGATMRRSDGSTWIVSVCEPLSHLHITQTKGCGSTLSEIQVRLQGFGNTTLLGFHEQHIPDNASRDERGKFYMKALDMIEKLFNE